MHDDSKFQLTYNIEQLTYDVWFVLWCRILKERKILVSPHLTMSKNQEITHATTLRLHNYMHF